MGFKIERNDITKVKADAIVNTCNPEPCVGGGVDTAIYTAAGWDDLLAERQKIGSIPEGEVAETPAFALSAQYIIHASGPKWRGGTNGEQEKLRACYQKSMELAVQLGCESIAFPFMATGSYAFPREEAFKIATDTIGAFLLAHELDVILVLFDSSSVNVAGSLFDEVRAYVDENYVEEHFGFEYGGRENRVPYCAQYSAPCSAPSAAVPNSSKKPKRRSLFSGLGRSRREDDFCEKSIRPCSDNSQDETREAFEDFESIGLPALAPSPAKGHDLDDYLEMAQGSFGEYIQQLINKKGMKNSEVYNAAGMNKQAFSKIINGVTNPKKLNVLALAVGLRLNRDEMVDLLSHAGYALTRSSKTDLIFMYFIDREEYNIVVIDAALYDHDQPHIFND